MLNILVACKEIKTPGGMQWLGTDIRQLYNTSPHWGEASNDLLDVATKFGGDALFLDDDTTLTEESLDGVREHYDAADLFGLDLHDMSGARQAGARHVAAYDGTLSDWVQPGPAYVAHVSTSAIYIKAEALRAGIRFPLWPGLHWEDVALCLDAWLHGFKVLAVPGYVHHDISGGVGSIKRHDPQFWARWSANKAAFDGWCGERSVMQALADGRIPTGAKEL